jgi:CO/xanthine dehydrogenase Mo-binding subunit
VYHSQTNFAEECFLDELAALAKQDPYEYRKKLLESTAPMKTPGGSFEPARLRAVLDSVAKQSGWGKPAPKGRFRGIACASAFGSYSAMVAEVSVTGEKIKVHEVWGAMDCGQIINPDTLEAQFESSVVFGLTAAMKSEITIEKGRVKQSNFHDVPMLRINETPKIHVELIKSSAAPTGAGEPGVPVVAPAVSNAVFAATGKRLRRMPFKLG